MKVPINSPLLQKIEDCLNKKNKMQGKDRDSRKGIEQKEKLTDLNVRDLKCQHWHLLL